MFFYAKLQQNVLQLRGMRAGQRACLRFRHKPGISCSRSAAVRPQARLRVNTDPSASSFEQQPKYCNPMKQSREKIAIHAPA
jgi:hypothetical protein